MQNLIKIKPLSVNNVWQGRRYKTQAYKDYEAKCIYLLPSKLEIPEDKLKIDIEFGVSSKLADIDNPLKPFLDILQVKYGFNDKNIYELNVKKTIVDKNKEYIKFDITESEL